LLLSAGAVEYAVTITSRSTDLLGELCCPPCVEAHTACPGLVQFVCDPQVIGAGGLTLE
jgi:hypothetical protein